MIDFQADSVIGKTPDSRHLILICMKSKNKEKSPEKTEEKVTQDNTNIKKVLGIIGKIINYDQSKPRYIKI